MSSLRSGLLSIVCLCILSAQIASAELKTMTVDINKLYNGYYVTQKDKATLKLEQETYTKERKERQKAIVELNGKIKAVIAKLRGKAMPDREKKNLAAEYENLVSQYNALNKDFKESDQDKLNENKKKIAELRRKGINDISKVVQKFAKDNGYHWVMETSGKSNTQISPLVYARKTEDKTDEILTLLNKEAPEEEEKEDEEKNESEESSNDQG